MFMYHLLTSRTDALVGINQGGGITDYYNPAADMRHTAAIGATRSS